MSDHLTYLDRVTVDRAFAEMDPLAAVHEALVLHAKGDAVLADESYLSWVPLPGERARSLAMPGLLGGDLHAAGVKIINANPANLARGMPRADGLFVLFDHVTAHPLCVLEGGDLSALRTAAVSALAVQHLAVEPTGTLAVVGAGVLGRVHAEVLAARAGVERILLHDRHADRARNLAATLAVEHDIDIDVAPTVEKALVEASVVVTATTTTTPYVSLAMLRPGALVVNVSLDDLDETVLLGADRLYVDDWNLIVADDHRVLGRLARAGRVAGPGAESGGPQARRVDGTLGQLFAGLVGGRRTAEETIVVNPFGMAICDLALARLVHAISVQRGWGLALERGSRAWT